VTTLLRYLLGTFGGVNVLAAGHVPADPEILDRYIQASRTRQIALQNEPMQVEITATVLKSHRQSQLRALRSVSGSGEIAYDILQTSGDDGIRRQVIARYLTAESQSHDSDATGVTELNYKFRLKAIVERLGRRVQVLELTPRKKKLGLFKGELWLDEATGMPVRESGRLMKSRNWLVKRILFVRTYELCDGLALPASIDSTVETRVAGNVELNIRFSDVNPRFCDER
jgi:hypothetical protein